MLEIKVQISGPRGIGKSMLAQKLAVYLRKAGHQVDTVDGVWTGSKGATAKKCASLFSDPRKIKITVKGG